MRADRPDELVIERVIDAPIESVWDAWTTEAGLATWWWAGWNDTTYHVELRVGGSYRITVPSVGIGVSGEFVEVQRPHRLVMTWIWEDDDGRGPVERVTIDLGNDGAATTVTVHHGGPWNTADGAANYEQGWNDVLSALAEAVRTESLPVTSLPVHRVRGIGGVFFRSEDPAATLGWYERHLGLDAEADFPCATLRWRGGETTVWAPFDSATDYFGDSDQEFMVNYRVDDLTAMIEQLRRAGVEVSDPTRLANGDFAWATDGDGHRFELWQPTVDQ